MFKTLAIAAFLMTSSSVFAQQDRSAQANATISSCTFAGLNLEVQVTSTPTDPSAADGSLYLVTANILIPGAEAIPSIGKACNVMPRGGYHCAFLLNATTRAELNFTLVDHAMTKAGVVVWTNNGPKSATTQNCSLK